LLLEGIRQFNAQEFFQCHETLENLWQNYQEPSRKAIQGIIQIAVAYYHLRNGNLPGARKLFQAGLSKIKDFSPTCLGIDIDQLVASVEASMTCLGETGSQTLLKPADPAIIKFDARSI
jgi:predicted metal-dependent hydrolase